MVSKRPTKKAIYDSAVERPALLYHLTQLYGSEEGPAVCQRLLDLMASYRTRVPTNVTPDVSEKDSVLITYGDMVRQGDEKPLITLTKFLESTIAGTVSSVHVLPFYPWTSDDGFSVSDYRQVDPNLGRWSDIKRMSLSFRMMFDAVINHISSESEWFKSFLNQEQPFVDWFHVVDPATDLTDVFRPKALPLLTPFDTSDGSTLHVWTTFSSDQVDLNYSNPEVFLAIVDVLLDYVCHGADFIRLDAIGFMWKKVGTSCLHLPQTHSAIQLIRTILSIMAPHVSLITETNVPHEQNVSYFGDGTNEAQMVYNFSLPPLTLHAFHTGNATLLSNWASNLRLPSDQVTFFNFLSSHDGIGVTPAKGLLNDDEILAMANRVKALGGEVSYKTNSDGTQSPYELNINYMDALGNPGEKENSRDKSARFLASQAIMLTLQGVPGIYFHSLFGSESWIDGIEETGNKRAINREKLRYVDLCADLNDINSIRSQVFYRFRHMIAVRSAEPAFNPYGEQKIFQLNPGLFCILRGTGEDAVFCIQNVTDQKIRVKLDSSQIFKTNTNWYRNIINNEIFEDEFDVKPYGIYWLKLH